MMEIVCLIRSNPPLIYFVNAINEKHPVSLVIVENPELHEEQDTVEDSDTGFWRKCQRFGIRGLLASFMKKILSSIEKQKNTGIRAQHYLEDRTDEFNEILDRIFGDKWKKIDDQIERVDVPNINVNEVQEMIAAKKGCIVFSLVRMN